MRKDLLAALARSTLALLALAALLLGLPIALAVLAGWPLPSAVPTLDQLRRALNGPSISDAALIKGIAVICWLAWTQLVACAVIETHAWVTGRAAARLPLAGAIQPLVRQLVLSIVFLAGALRTPSPMTVPVRAVTAVQLMPVARVPDVGVQPVATTAPVAGPASTQAELACVVRARDSLWSLAEHHLGDGYRWRDLFELNRGVPQSDGRSLQKPGLIRPGWTIRFPADATGLARGGSETPQLSPTPPPAPASPEAPMTSPQAAAPSVFTDQAVEAAKPTMPAAPASGSAKAEPAPAPPANDHKPHKDPISARVASLGLLAAGFVVTLDRLRRVQQRKRRTGRTIPLPAEASAGAERLLRAAAAHSPADRLDAALRAFSAELSNRKTGPVPNVEAVSVADGAVEILLSGSTTAPPGPFEVTAGGRSWTLPMDVDVAALAAERSAPAPALVTVGTAVDGRQVLIDLETHPRTVIVGDQSASEAFFAALVLELSTSRWVDAVHVVLAGGSQKGLGSLDRLRVVASIGEALNDLEAESLALTAELAATGHGSTFSARLDQRADGWVPTVVLVADPADPSLAHLLQVAGENHGLAVVVLGDPPGDADRRITIERGTTSVTPPGLDLMASAITAEEIDRIGDILDLAASEEEGDAIVLSPDSLASAPGANEGGPVSIENRDEAQEREVDVRVLGYPELIGGSIPIDRKKSKELVVYLALHPRGADEGRLKTALWPDQIPSQGTFNQTMSKARTSLGRRANGDHHLPHVADGLYRLGPAVDTDFRRLEQVYEAATTNGTAATMDALAEALAAVRGMPFEGAGGGYEWAHTEGLLARIEAITADAALLLAEWHLDRRNTAKTLWAAGQGLLASPGDERLFRIRMRAHDQAGNPAGVEAVMEELCRVVEALEPYDDLHPETVALYEELRRRGRRTG